MLIRSTVLLQLFKTLPQIGRERRKCSNCLPASLPPSLPPLSRWSRSPWAFSSGPLTQVLSERPSDASAVFEHLSASVKEGTVKPDSTTPSMGKQSAAAEQLKWAQTSQALFVVPDEPPEGGAVVPDMLDEANMWEWGGVSFGRLETYRLYLSVKKVGMLEKTFPRGSTILTVATVGCICSLLRGEGNHSTRNFVHLVLLPIGLCRQALRKRTLPHIVPSSMRRGLELGDLYGTIARHCRCRKIDVRSQLFTHLQTSFWSTEEQPPQKSKTTTLNGPAPADRPLNQNQTLPPYAPL